MKNIILLKIIHGFIFIFAVSITPVYGWYEGETVRFKSIPESDDPHLKSFYENLICLDTDYIYTALIPLEHYNDVTHIGENKSGWIVNRECITVNGTIVEKSVIFDHGDYYIMLCITED